MTISDIIEIIKQISKNTTSSGDPFSFRKGTVESVQPLTISIDQKLLLEESDLVLTHLVRDYFVDVSVSHTTEDFGISEGKYTDIKDHSHEYKGRKKIQIHNGLQEGENVILFKIQGGQLYIVLDRYTDPVTKGEWT